MTQEARRECVLIIIGPSRMGCTKIMDQPAAPDLGRRKSRSGHSKRGLSENPSTLLSLESGGWGVKVPSSYGVILDPPLTR